MHTIGILSDTHLTQCDELFIQKCNKVFERCDSIIHCGDLTELAILSAFKNKEVYAVSGNMCSQVTKKHLPKSLEITIEGITLAITHGTGDRWTIEERVYTQFPSADCIFFGHSHIPVCTKFGETLLINPGSFRGTGRYGSSGTYAIVSLQHHKIINHKIQSFNSE